MNNKVSDNNRSKLPNIEAFVKGTPSGDSLIVTHPKKLPPVEKVISLAYIKCPQMGRPTEKDVEEPFAFEARELVRKACIGKLVTLSHQYTHPKSRRDYCKVLTGEDDLGLSLLKKGLAYINYKRNQDKDEYDEAEEEAKNNSLGIWGSKKQLDKNAREVYWHGYDYENILKTYKGKSIQAIVEFVSTGSQVKVLLPTNDIVTLLFTGIQCNGFKVVEEKKGGKKEKEEEKNDGKKKTYKKVDEKVEETNEEKKDEKKEETKEEKKDEKKDSKQENKDEKKEEKKKIKRKPAGLYANEAKHFTETRLLHRDVTLLLEGVDKFENFYGTILVNGKPFQVDLLEEGFAKISEWNISQTQYVKKLRAAEHKAKVKQLRLWKDFELPKSTLKSADKKLIPVQITELLSGDSFKAYNTVSKTEERYSLSSIRARKMGFSKQKTPEPLAYEAKEFLRKKLAGKNLTIKVDYRRKFSKSNEREEDKKDKKKGKKEEKKTTSQDEERLFVTLFANGKNVAVDLVSSGYAFVQKHKSDEERSGYYDKLMAAEIEAKNKNKGVHSESKDPDIWRINDISFDKGADKHLPSLKDRRLKATIEKVHSGSRYRVWVEKQSLLITFALSGVTSPSLNKNAKSPSDHKPFAVEAKDFSNKSLILHEVEILVDHCDKFGTFLGSLWLDNKNYAIDLLKNGYGFLNGSARRLESFELLNEAQEEALKEKKNLMSLTEEERDPKGYQMRVERENKQKEYKELRKKAKPELVPSQNRTPINIRVTEVVDSSHVYLQTSNSSKLIEEIEELIGESDLSKSPEGFSPKSGDVVLCQYSADGNWYRGKVLTNDKGSFKVFYLDYGNTETVKVDKLRPCTNAKLLKIGEQAKEAYLAYTEKPPKQYRPVADDFVRNFLFDQDLTAIHEYNDRNKVYLTIYNEEKQNLNLELIRNGLAFVTKDELIHSNFKDIIEDYANAEQRAILNRVYLWEKGEIYGSDDEELF